MHYLSPFFINLATIGIVITASHNPEEVNVSTVHVCYNYGIVTILESFVIESLPLEGY